MHEKLRGLALDWFAARATPSMDFHGLVFLKKEVGRLGCEKLGFWAMKNFFWIEMLNEKVKRAS